MDSGRRPSALVTGATSGIGRALCQELGRAGVEVLATGRSAERLSEVTRETGCRGRVLDLADEDAPRALYRWAKEQLGTAPDFLVNNAGYNSRKAPLTEVTDAEWDAQYRVNLRAPALLCRDALIDMAARRSGHIVNVLSTVVHLGIENMGTYTAMKQGLYGLTRVLIKEARDAGVKVTAVHPGGTDTGFRAQARPDYMQAESVAKMICGVLFSPPDVVVHDLTFRPMVETNF
jgi:NAD(P)-dependent dehydrogenase (short-subunit alcohol dehydrogenase family)